jgi:phosphatidylglycerophosphate synthase
VTGTRRLQRGIPLALTLLRASLAPVVACLAICAPSRVGFGLCLTLAFLSDVFDGIVARRLGVATATLRRLDSITDTVFYLAVIYAAWHLHPAAISSRIRPIIALSCLEIVRYGFDWIKFRREASYHMWSSKAWGIALFAGFFSLLALGSDNVLLTVAVYVGILADCEGLIISMVMRSWKADVPTVVHALRAP